MIYRDGEKRRDLYLIVLYFLFNKHKTKKMTKFECWTRTSKADWNLIHKYFRISFTQHRRAGGMEVRVQSTNQYWVISLINWGYFNIWTQIVPPPVGSFRFQSFTQVLSSRRWLVFQKLPSQHGILWFELVLCLVSCLYCAHIFVCGHDCNNNGMAQYWLDGPEYLSPVTLFSLHLLIHSLPPPPPISYLRSLIPQPFLFSLTLFPCYNPLSTSGPGLIFNCSLSECLISQNSWTTLKKFQFSSTITTKFWTTMI